MNDILICAMCLLSGIVGGAAIIISVWMNADKKAIERGHIMLGDQIFALVPITLADVWDYENNCVKSLKGE